MSVCIRPLRLSAVTFALVAACSGSPTGGSVGGNLEPLDVTVRTTNDLRFVEPSVFVRQGGVVRFYSESGLRHSVTPVGHDLWEPVEAQDRGVNMLTVYFPDPGVYEYRCDYHHQDGMVGQIVVVASGS
jgi:plastocyanin